MSQSQLVSWPLLSANSANVSPWQGLGLQKQPNVLSFNFGISLQNKQPHVTEKNKFIEGGRKIAIKRGKGDVQIVPLCND